MTWDVFDSSDQTYKPYKPYMPEQGLPSHLGHKPVYAMPYQAFEEKDVEETDARYLSVGLSQWNKYGAKDISLKILRWTGTGQWSPQSEEMPLCRVFDAAMFLAKVILDSRDDQIELEPDLFNKQGLLIRVLREDGLSDDENTIFDDGIMNDVLKKRINSLYYLLDALKKKGLY